MGIVIFNLILIQREIRQALGVEFLFHSGQERFAHFCCPDSSWQTYSLPKMPCRIPINKT